jgi:hypothetical protein
VVNAENAGAFFRLPSASMQSMTNGKSLISLVLDLSNALLSEAEGRKWSQIVQGFLK